MFLLGKRKPKKEKRKIPKTVQQSIPIDKLYRDGVFKCGHIYSKTWRFSDINYTYSHLDANSKVSSLNTLAGVVNI